MSQTRLAKLLDHFASLPDPRIDRRKLHALVSETRQGPCAVKFAVPRAPRPASLA
jgi:hypothetical protein